MEDKKVLLSVKDLEVKFHVRGRILTAIRGISLDIYENESIAIVGESGSGKSVFTKTFAGMLDSNGFISNGSIILNDEALQDTVVDFGEKSRKTVQNTYNKLNEYSKLEFGAKTYNEIKALEAEKEAKSNISDELKAEFETKMNDVTHDITELQNYRQTIASSNKEEIKSTNEKIKTLEAELKKLSDDLKAKSKEASDAAKNDSSYNAAYTSKHDELTARYKNEITAEISEETKQRNMLIAKEIQLSCGRFNWRQRTKSIRGLLKVLKQAMTEGKDLNDEEVRNDLFDNVTFRVKYLDETESQLHGTTVINLAKIKSEKDWTQIRGRRIATVFQDPMTSLNPIITIGKQISSIIIKHQQCSEVEARRKAIELMNKVGIPNAEERFDDYPFQYSGGMRQRFVIAIALSCQPKILICDEPTTALDVTIQAQILKLIKDLQKEFEYTIVFITHDLGVVANVADRVAVLYAGQIIELGTVEDIFYDPRHPYTWALLSSLPQLAQRNTELYSITGTPPSLYNNIVGDAFAPRNPYAMKIDTILEPDLFQVSETHWAKTWLLDENAPKVEKPEIIQDIHEKLIKAFNIQES